MQEKLKVCHVHLGLDHGGAETFLIKLTGALERRGVEQVAIVGKGRIWAPRVAENCDVLELPFRRGLAGLFANWRLRRFIKRYQPDVVMAWMNRAARRIPKGKWLTVGRLGGYYVIKHYKNCDYLVGNTPDLVEYIVKNGIPRERVRMISNFPGMVPTEPKPRAELNTPDDAKLIIGWGRLEEQEGFDVLLRALPSLPGMYAWILGEGTQRAALERLAEELGVADRVRFTGWIVGPASYVSAADICVVPSRHEPLGNSILEAWGMEKPVIAAASEGPSWLIKDGVNGLLVPVGDHEQLGAAIARVASDEMLAKRLVKGATEIMEREFSEEAISRSFIELFKQPKPTV